MHARTRPVEHRLEYPVYMLLVDLDELAELDARLRLFSVNRPNLIALHDADFAGARGIGLGAAAVDFLRAGGVDAGPGWRFELLCHPRTFGFVFNPVTFTLCHAPDGALAAVIAEVRNTFGKVHRHLLDARAAIPAPGGRGASYRADKLLHVSPFFDLDLSWLFHIRAVDDRLDVAMDVIHDFEPSAPGERRGPPLMVARLWGERRPLTDGTLARLLARYPLMTVQVVAAIHWEALKLWLRGAPFHHEPPYDPEAARNRHARTHADADLRAGAAHDRPPGAPPGAGRARAAS
jgi:hypothetical protein